MVRNDELFAVPDSVRQFRGENVNRDREEAARTSGRRGRSLWTPASWNRLESGRGRSCPSHTGYRGGIYGTEDSVVRQGLPFNRFANIVRVSFVESTPFSVAILRTTDSLGPLKSGRRESFTSIRKNPGFPGCSVSGTQ